MNEEEKEFLAEVDQPEDPREDEERQEEYEHPDYAAQLVHMLRSGLNSEETAERLADYHANDIANALPELTRDERIRLYHLLGQDEVSEVFSYLEDPGEYLSELGIETAADILESMDADDAVDALEELDEDAQKAIFAKMDEDAKEDIRLIRSYDEDEIGSRMTTNYIELKRGLSVKQAMRSVTEQAAENDNLSVLYFVNEDGSLYGTMTLQELIIARKKADLDSLITTECPFVYDHETVQECIEDLKEYSEDSIPVVDNDKKLLGVITSQDLVEVVDEEMGEDLAKLGGLTEEEDLKESLPQSIRKRIPWLLILMALGLVVSAVVGVFEKVVENLTIVVAFQSVILGMSGNVGTQSLAVTIRVLSDDNTTGAQKFKLMLKELRIGICNGLLLGTASMLFVACYIRYLKAGYDWTNAFRISGCLGAAMLLSMTISSLTGTLIPMFFKKIKVDPAVASGPLITTVNDLVAVVTYYGLAMLLLLPIMS